MEKKRILIVNKFLYPRGGDCIVALSDAELLRQAGHEVELWGMDYPKNIPDLPLEDTFAPEVSFSGGISAKVSALKRVFGLGDIQKSFREALERFRPDTVFFHNIHSYLSPVIVGMAKEYGARTIWTMHDYKLICPAYNALDPSGRCCTGCISNPRAVIAGRCMKGSLPQSLTAYAEARRWSRPALLKVTDLFICPSRFMASKLHEGGIPGSRTAVVCNALDPAKALAFDRLDPVKHRRRMRLIYVGRLSAEKGVSEMLEELSGLADLQLSIDIYGGGPLEESLRERYSSSPNIVFHGHSPAETIARALTEASLLICPSRCYENNPLSVIEGLCSGTPVIGADMGGIPELINEDAGVIYNPFTPGALTEAVRQALATDWDHQAIAAQARERFSARNHLNILSKLL